MKTYVLTLSKVFPSTHARAGQLTDFKTAFNNAILCAKCQEKPKGMCMGECIIGFRKIHTIRANYRLWTKRIAEDNEFALKTSVNDKFFAALPANRLLGWAYESDGRIKLPLFKKLRKYWHQHLRPFKWFWIFWVALLIYVLSI